MTAALPEPARWQPMLDRHSTLFGKLTDGCRIGVVAREGAAPGPDMIVWEALAGRLVAASLPFEGFERAGVDVLLSGNEEAMAELGAALDGDPLPVLKRHVRQGGIVCYVLKRQCELLDAGYEDVLQSLGVAFAGACR
jgi:hypothetical protein